MKRCELKLAESGQTLFYWFMKRSRTGCRAATEQQIRDFERSYDLSFIWASDEVVGAVGNLLDAIAIHTAAPGSMPQPKMKELYIECMAAMRRDGGFDSTTAQYRVVSF